MPCDRCQRLIDTLRWVKLMIRPRQEGGYRDWKTIMFVVEAEIEYFERITLQSKDADVTTYSACKVPNRITD